MVSVIVGAGSGCHRDDQRAEELINVRWALATFALQLDAFEVRLNGRETKINGEPSKPISPGTAFAKQVIGAMKNRSPPN
jgi:hypothetical protein